MSYNIIPGREYKFSTGIYFIDSDSKDYSFVFNNYKVYNLILHKEDKMFNWFKKFFRKFKKEDSIQKSHFRMKRGSIEVLEELNIVVLDGEPILVKQNGQYIGFKIGRNDGVECDGIKGGAYFNDLPLYKFSTISTDDIVDNLNNRKGNMSKDFKVIECSTNNLDEPKIEYNFLDYVSIRSTDSDCFWEIYESTDARRFIEKPDDELRVFDSIVFKKTKLLDIIDKYECDLQEQLKELIDRSNFDYIVLQLF